MHLDVCAPDTFSSSRSDPSRTPAPAFTWVRSGVLGQGSVISSFHSHHKKHGIIQTVCALERSSALKESGKQFSHSRQGRHTLSCEGDAQPRATCRVQWGRTPRELGRGWQLKICSDGFAWSTVPEMNLEGWKIAGVAALSVKQQKKCCCCRRC